MKKLILVFGLLTFLWGCSGSQNTADMTPEDHFNYAMELYNDEDYQEAIIEFQAILLQNQGSSINDDAQYYLAYSYYNRAQYILAAYEFSKLIKDIPASSLVPDAQFMLSDSYYMQSPPYSLDQAFTRKAIEEFQAFIDFFPANPKVTEAETKIKELNEKLAEKEYYSAYIYEKSELYGSYNAALKYYTYVYETYHDTKFAPLSLYRKIQLLLEKNRTKEAAIDISTFLSRYPDDDKSLELQEVYNKLTGEG